MAKAVTGGHLREPHEGSLAGRLNWLRAGVLGANDGIISTAGLVIGVAAATTNSTEIATAGGAGLVAGAVSMALGEYVSVSTQRDTERALIEKERRELELMPEAEHAELVGLLRQRGLSEDTAITAADELSTGDVLRTHLSVELGIDQEELANPWSAAGSSAVAFVAVLVGLGVTGVVSARLGGSPWRAAVVRLVAGGALAMTVTFGIGRLLGVATG